MFTSDTAAVLTGDIVKSQDLPAGELDKIFDALLDAARAIGAWQGQSACFTRFRGDGWQVLVTDEAFVFRAVMILRAAVRRIKKGYDTRISLAIGPVEVPGKDLGAASGLAFTQSGRGLDELSGKSRLAISGDVPLRLQTSLPLATEISQGWTALQAQVAMEALRHSEIMSARQVADVLEQTRQNVEKHYASAAVEILRHVALQLEGLE